MEKSQNIRTNGLFGSLRREESGGEESRVE